MCHYYLIFQTWPFLDKLFKLTLRFKSNYSNSVWNFRIESIDVVVWYALLSRNKFPISNLLSLLQSQTNLENFCNFRDEILHFTLFFLSLIYVDKKLSIEIENGQKLKYDILWQGKGPLEFPDRIIRSRFFRFFLLFEGTVFWRKKPNFSVFSVFIFTTFKAKYYVKFVNLRYIELLASRFFLIRSIGVNQVHEKQLLILAFYEKRRKKRMFMFSRNYC